MSDFALKLHVPEPEPIERYQAHGTSWIWFDDAARLLGVSDGQVRRRCKELWEAKLLARKATRANGQEAWQVSTLADARLQVARAPSPADKVDEVDLGKLTDRQRDVLLQHERTLQEWQRRLDAGLTLGVPEATITKRFIEEQRLVGGKCSRGSLYRWAAAYRKEGRGGLVDPRWHVEGAERSDDLPVYRDTLKRIYLNQRQLSIRQCHERASQAAEDAGETPPGYKTAQRILNAIPRDTVVLLREGETAYTNKVAKFIRVDHSSIASNDWWISDNFRFDVMVRTPDGEICRAWLHSWMDMRSRMIVGFAVVLHDANAELVLRTFRRAVRRHGAPRHVYLDNGHEYDNRALQGRSKKERFAARAARRAGDLDAPERARVGGAFGDLGIEVHFAEAYHGQSKGIIERWHRRINDQFARDFASYCGGDVTKKPDDLALKLAQDQIPTLDYFVEAFGQWVEGYNSVPHMGDAMDGRSPAVVYAASLPASVRRPAEASLRIACSLHIPAIVRQNGVHWNDCSWHSHELDKRLGQRVTVDIDTECLDDVLVRDAAGVTICMAKADRRLPQGATSQQIREARADMRRNKRKAREYMEARPRLSLDTVELMRLRQAKLATEQAVAAAATGTDGNAPSIEPVRTPFDDQSNAIRSAIERAQPNTLKVAPADAGAHDPSHGRFRYVRAQRTDEEDARDE